MFELQPNILKKRFGDGDGANTPKINFLASGQMGTSLGSLWWSAVVLRSELRVFNTHRIPFAKVILLY